MQRFGAAGVEERRLEELHVVVAVDDAGALAFEHAGVGAHVGFALTDLALREEPRRDPVVADLARERVHFLQLAHLLRVLRDDPFLRVAVRDAVARAQLVEHALAAQTEVGLERAVAVVESGVDDFAVARRGFAADHAVALDQERACVGFVVC